MNLIPASKDDRSGLKVYQPIEKAMQVKDVSLIQDMSTPRDDESDI